MSADYAANLPWSNLAELRVLKGLIRQYPGLMAWVLPHRRRDLASSLRVDVRYPPRHLPTSKRPSQKAPAR